MAARRSKNNSEQGEPKMKQGAKARLVIMIISVVLMIFSVTQVYYLSKFTLGYEVPKEKLNLYIWVCKLMDGNATQE